MAHPLDGCREKVVRAGDHLEALKREILRFTDDQGYVFPVEHDPQTREQVVRLRAKRRPPLDPPTHLGIVVGDVMHNLRSALDHLVWQLAVIGDGPGERNQFPIFDSPKVFEAKRPTYLHGVRPEHGTVIEGYQPYKGLPEGRSLTLLAKFNDVDKHRVVHSGIRFGKLGPDSITISNIRSADVRAPAFSYLIDGAELYRIAAAEIIDPSQEVEVHTRIPSAIAFGEVPFAASFADFLRMRDTVSNIVEAFRGEFVGE
jgi:hypothetical protein